MIIIFDNSKPVGIFSAEHIFFLAMAMLLCAAAILAGRRLGERGRRFLLITLWGIFTAIELSRYVYFGFFPDEFNIKTGLPFHLCSISIFTYPIAIFTKNETFRNFIYAVNMPGALFALITPDIGKSTVFSFYFMHLMTAHTFIVLIPLYMVLCGIFLPNSAKLPSVALVLGGTMLPALLLNKYLGSNYYFINGPVRGTLTQTFADWLGDGLYLLPMLAALLAAWGILYLPFDIAELYKAHSQNKPIKEGAEPN